jgi:endonuclease G
MKEREGVKTRLLAYVKKGALFFSIFCGGCLVSGFFFQQQNKPGITAVGFPIFKQKGYTLVYDGRAKVPLWTYEQITEKNLVQNVARKGMHFYENQKIYAPHRSTLADYYHSGYDRGHMVPVRDQQCSKEQLKETFLLSNVCPQNSEFNRGYWRKLEEHARKQLKGNERIEVISGPLYLPIEEGGQKVVKYQVIGENQVAVPTHFYKVILVHSKKKKERIYAYIVPNALIDTKIPVEQYEVSLFEVEKASGLFFELSKSKPKTVIEL